MNKAVVKYMFIVFITILVVVAIASYFYWKSDNVLGPNLITAFVGVVVSALVTLVLLNGQTKDEEEKERNLELYNKKLKIFAEFNEKLWKQDAIDDTTDVRDACLTELIFYLSEEEINNLSKLIKILSNADLEEHRAKITESKARITQLLRDALDKGDYIIKEKDIAPIYKYQPFKLLHTLYVKVKDITGSLIYLFESQPKGSKIVSEITSLHDILTPEPQDNNTSSLIRETKDNKPISEIYSDSNYEKTGEKTEDYTVEVKDLLSDNNKKFEVQAWHFNAWDSRQFEQFNNIEKTEKCELSLIEYEENWRTNLVKQVHEGDIIMLFRRGGYGYVGAFKAIGWRVFNFEEGEGKGQEEIVFFGEKPIIVTERDNEDRFWKDIQKYDIYNSKEDGATLCSNLIVKPIAYVPEGVGNPGGVYRRTISRYDSHYAWLLKERFQEKGQWKDG